MTDFQPFERWTGPVPLRYGKQRIPPLHEVIGVTVGLAIGAGLAVFVPLTILSYAYYRLLTRDGMTGNWAFWWADYGTYPTALGGLATAAIFVWLSMVFAGDRREHKWDFVIWDEARVRENHARAEQEKQALVAAEQRRQAEAVAAQHQVHVTLENQTIARDVNRLNELERLFLSAYADHAARVDFAGNLPAEAVNAPFVEWFLAQNFERAGLLRFTGIKRIREVMGEALRHRLPPGILHQRDANGYFFFVRGDAEAGDSVWYFGTTLPPPLNPPHGVPIWLLSRKT